MRWRLYRMLMAQSLVLCVAAYVDLYLLGYSLCWLYGKMFR